MIIVNEACLKESLSDCEIKIQNNSYHPIQLGHVGQARLKIKDVKDGMV